MFEINSDVLILCAGLIIGLLIIKLITKFLFRAIGVIILLTLGSIYVYFFTNFFEENKDNRIVQHVESKFEFASVLEYQEEHCMDGPKSRIDSITCECIIAPLVNDLKTKFTGDEIEELKKDKQRYKKEIIISLRKNQYEIIEKLKARKAVHIWNKMIRNLKKGKFVGDY
jgi:energy-coupling factor transporter transmembrane protein EcfT